MRIIPITLKDANEFVKMNHRHHDSYVGCRFAIGLQDGGILIGVAICGRPVSRHLDDGFTLEINRLCVTESHRNACSMLYGACVRIARNMGYRKVITYILESENGASVKAANFRDDGFAGGEIWTGERRRDRGVPRELKRRFVFDLVSGGSDL